MTAIILAGGKSSRMGIDKGLLELYGKPLVQHSIETVNYITNDIIIISNQRGYDKFGLPVYEDYFKSKGPAGGIYTGLLHSTSKYNLVLGCDMPYLSNALLKYLAGFCKPGFDAYVPVVGKNPQPLCAIYTANCAEMLKTAIEKGQLKMVSLIKEWNTNYIKISSKLKFYSPYLFANINTRQDLVKLISHI